MSHNLNQSIQRFQQCLSASEISLAQTKDHLQAALAASEQELTSREQSARVRLEQTQAEAASAKDKVLHYLEHKKDELLAKFEDWRTDREIEKLEKAADSKEDHAINAIITAAYALLEAEVAVLEALKARKIAIEVAG